MDIILMTQLKAGFSTDICVKFVCILHRFIIFVSQKLTHFTWSPATVFQLPLIFLICVVVTELRHYYQRLLVKHSLGLVVRKPVVTDFLLATWRKL